MHIVVYCICYESDFNKSCEIQSNVTVFCSMLWYCAKARVHWWCTVTYSQEQEYASVRHGIRQSQDSTAHDSVAEVKHRHSKWSLPFKLPETQRWYAQNVKNMEGISILRANAAITCNITIFYYIYNILYLHCYVVKQNHYIELNIYFALTSVNWVFFPLLLLCGKKFSCSGENLHIFKNKREEKTLPSIDHYRLQKICGFSTKIKIF